MNVDEASNSKGDGVGLVLITPDGSIIEQFYTLGFQTTNNEAEYEAVIVGLKMATTLGVTELEVRCDSLLLVSQVNGDYIANNNQIAKYLKVVTTWKAKFSHCNFKQVLRFENSHTDSRDTLALTVDFQFRREIPIKHIPKPSIQKSDEEIFRLDHSPG